MFKDSLRTNRHITVILTFFHFGADFLASQCVGDIPYNKHNLMLLFLRVCGRAKVKRRLLGSDVRSNYSAYEGVVERWCKVGFSGV